MKKRRFPRISPTMARRVVMVMLIIALGIPLMGCGVLVLWTDDNAWIEEGGEVRTICSYCGAKFAELDAVGHGDGICNKQEEPPQEETPSAATCQVCQGTLAEGESHAAPCGNNAHCTKDGKKHDKLACGHYTCDGKKHDKLTCGHYTCDGKTHEKAACGHYACDGGSHGAAACGIAGHFACDDGLHKKAPCGHWACNLSGEAADHEQCPDCGKYFCDGHTHALQCPGCGAEVGDTTDHMAPCRNAEHLTCAAGYVADSHVNYADCNAHTLCDSRDHSRCQCSIPKCSSQYVAAEHGLLVCGRHCKYNVPDDIEDTHTVNCPYV